jgi:hypothetical protein
MMNPGTVPEEAGQTARSLIDIFRQQPLSLGLLLINLALLGYLYYEGVQAHDERLEEKRLLYENRKYVGDLLANCYPAPPPQR